MTDKLYKSIEKLRTFSPQLNAATDKANATVLAVEKFLNEECRLGLPCYTTVSTNMPEEERSLAANGDTEFANVNDFEGIFLGYDRVGSKFRIVIKTTDPERDSQGNLTGGVFGRTKPWADCARDDKLKSFRNLPELLEVIASDIDTLIKETDETAATVDRIMGALSGDAIEKSPVVKTATTARTMSSVVFEAKK